MSGRGLTKRQREKLHAELAERWPLIGWWLTVDRIGWVDGNDLAWSDGAKGRGLTEDELAAGYEQWVQFYEWHLAQRTDEDGWDYVRSVWTDSYAYILRRQATKARGEDPGPWIDQWTRSPDLFKRIKEFRDAPDRALDDAA